MTAREQVLRHLQANPSTWFSAGQLARELLDDPTQVSPSMTTVLKTLKDLEAEHLADSKATGLYRYDRPKRKYRLASPSE